MARKNQQHVSTIAWEKAAQKELAQSIAKKHGFKSLSRFMRQSLNFIVLKEAEAGSFFAEIIEKQKQPVSLAQKFDSVTFDSDVINSENDVIIDKVATHSEEPKEKAQGKELLAPWDIEE